MNVRQAKWILTTMSLLFLIGGLTMSYFIQENVKLKILLSEANLKTSQKKLELNISQWLIGKYRKYANQKVENTDIVEIGKGQKDLMTILNSEYKIVFKFSESDCISCIEDEIRNIKSKIGNDYNNIIIFVRTKDERWLSNFISNNDLYSNSVYQIEEALTEEGESPFYFAINSELVLRDIFFPIKELPCISGAYYETMQKKYFTVRKSFKTKSP